MGLSFGGVRLGERLGSGGGGDVFRARELRTGREVAVKVLRDPRALPQLERALAVRHPALVCLFGTGICPAGSYVVMELLEGETLRPVLERRGRLDVPAAVAVLLPVLEALAAAHGHGLVHGDVSPENVFLERLQDGGIRVKLLDLGGAPPAADDDAVVGSAAYLSPEHAAGEPLDARSDVFGAGVLLFELVRGRPPFAGRSAVASAYATVHAPAPRVDDPRLQAVLDVALAKAPADRFPGAAAFARALAAGFPRDALSAGALSALATP